MKKYICILILIFINNLFIFAETKTAIQSSELNLLIQEHITKNYPDYHISEAFKVNKQGVISYEVIVVKEKTSVILYYNSQGEFIRKATPPIKKKIVPLQQKKR